MKKKSARILFAAVMAVVFAFSAASLAQDTETVLFTFHLSNGSFPLALINDAAGNLYGVTSVGGNQSCAPLGCGLIFKLSNSSGTWVETILHSFSGGDGSNPAAIAFDTHGNIYGTANFGGPNGSGVVFKLVPNGVGGWRFLILHAFPDGPTDGTYPNGAVVGADGNFYAASSSGGSSKCSGYGCGTVFKLSPTPAGPWKETILHRFAGAPGDGANPFGSLIFDTTGNIYGTTSDGGTGCVSGGGCGTAFKLSPNSSGPWTEAVLQSFTGPNGAYPGSLHLDPAGNLFGVALEGGSTNCSGGCGLVFELSQSSGLWTDTTLYEFTYTGDGSLPSALTIDSSGNLYGTATFAEPGVEGSAFELSPATGGGWNETTLYLFSNPVDGGAPTSILVDASGNLYGTTETGGDVSHTTSGDGVVFELTPPAASRN